MRTHIRAATIALAAAALAIPFASSTARAAQPFTFTTPVQLSGAGGGEPSIATDGVGNVYVTGPQGIPSGINGTPGVGLWTSRDNATTFGMKRYVGSFLGGGDSDIAVAPDDAKTVYLADLEAVAAAVCVSKDKGATFNGIGPLPDPGHCTTTSGGQAGPSDDREWLTPDRGGRAYLTYHEFVSAQPLVFRTDNGGQDLFGAGPCGSIVTDPAIEQNVPTDITGGTLVSKPVVDAKGNLYVLFTTTTQAQNAAALLAGQPSGTFSQAYLAVSTDHCASFTDYTVFDGSKLGTNSVQFGDIFNDLVIGGDGTLYTVAAGFVGSNAPKTATADIYVFSSRDGGKTWTAPEKVTDGNAGDAMLPAAHMLPAAVAGPGSGQLAIGYFRTTNGVTDPNDTKGKWTYTVAESTHAADGTSAQYSFADVALGTLYHNGDICNLGILCTSGDRSLLDFTSATIDAAGCPLFTFAGNNNEKKTTSNFVTRQTSGCFPVPPPPAPISNPVGNVQGAGATGSAQAVGSLPNTAAGRVGIGAIVVALLGVPVAATVGRRRRRRRAGG